MSENTAAATEERTRPKPLRQAVHERVTALQRGYVKDKPEAVALLARLRNGAGKLPQDTPDLWGLVCDPGEYVQPEWSRRREEQAETAVHIAMTLYALHQQSQRQEGMHRRAVREEGKPHREHDLGRAVRDLMPPGEIDEPLRQRLVQAGKATSTAVLAFRLRGIVQLLRRDSVPLDYGLLAAHLLTAQQPGGMSKVRCAWGRGFTAYRPASPDTESAPDTDTDKDIS